jgi:hypothetical protein
MTIDDAGWSLLDRRGRLETLERWECRRLLGSTSVGRLGPSAVIPAPVRWLPLFCVSYRR